MLITLLLLTACAKADVPIEATSVSTVEQKDLQIFGVFEGITPCSGKSPALPQIPKGSDCEEMIWKFTLYRDAASGAPTTYELISAYGLSKQNSTGLIGGGTEIAFSGTWEIIKGNAAYPNAVIYQLNSKEQGNIVSFIKIGDDVLHILNSDGAMMVGHAGWSYTINRTDNRPHEPITNAGSVPLPDGTLVIPTMPPDVYVLGVFEGRTPCHDLVFDFTGTPKYANCLKVKWQLTLYQDVTGEPDGYLFRGTSSVRQGTWTITQGTKDDPEAVVYQLRNEDESGSMSFLKADENHLFLLDERLDLLVGDALFSYTLSRTE
jgi:hypothetical protein